MSMITKDAPQHHSKGCGKRRRGAERTRVHVDGFPASHRVHAHNGVDGFDGLTTHSLSGRACTVRLRDSAVHGSEAFEILLEAGAERRVERVARVQ